MLLANNFFLDMDGLANAASDNRIDAALLVVAHVIAKFIAIVKVPIIKQRLENRIALLKLPLVVGIEVVHCRAPRGLAGLLPSIIDSYFAKSIPRFSSALFAASRVNSIPI